MKAGIKTIIFSILFLVCSCNKNNSVEPVIVHELEGKWVSTFADLREIHTPEDIEKADTCLSTIEFRDDMFTVKITDQSGRDMEEYKGKFVTLKDTLKLYLQNPNIEQVDYHEDYLFNNKNDSLKIWSPFYPDPILGGGSIRVRSFLWNYSMLKSEGYFIKTGN